MIISFIAAVISGFWIPRVYDIQYISKSLHVITFFFLSIIFGIFAILSELILTIEKLKEKIMNEEKGKVIPLGKNRFLIKFKTNEDKP
jgi:hypothetical protein